MTRYNGFPLCDAEATRPSPRVHCDCSHCFFLWHRWGRNKKNSGATVFFYGITVFYYGIGFFFKLVSDPSTSSERSTLKPLWQCGQCGHAQAPLPRSLPFPPRIRRCTQVCQHCNERMCFNPLPCGDPQHWCGLCDPGYEIPEVDMACKRTRPCSFERSRLECNRRGLPARCVRVADRSARPRIRGGRQHRAGPVHRL